MKNAWIMVAVALALLNAALLTSNAFLLHALELLKDEGLLAALADIKVERTALAGERARVSDAVSEARRLVGELRAEPGPPPELRARSTGAAVEEELEDVAVRFGVASRPDPRDIQRMDPEELAQLDRRRAELPRELNGAVLLRGDVDSVLEDPLWNPTGVDLPDAERGVLADLVSEYRYFARVSKIERFKNHVEPEIPRLREAGAYVEYPRDEPPPVPPGIYMSHAEGSEREGYYRIYYFPEADYPEMAHQRRVEEEQGLDSFLEIYDLINSPRGDSR